MKGITDINKNVPRFLAEAREKGYITEKVLINVMNALHRINKDFEEERRSLLCEIIKKDEEDGLYDE